MKCIYCGNEESKVLDSRTSDNSIRRRRECLNCGRRFTTYETIEAVPFLIIKKDGSKQSYNHEKFAKSLKVENGKRHRKKHSKPIFARAFFQRSWQNGT